MSADKPTTIPGTPPKEMNEEQAPQVPVPTSAPVTQVVGDRYMDFDQLNRYLEQTFGPQNFTLNVKLGKWIIVAPRKLTDDELDRVTQ